MCLAQGPQRSDAGEARTRGPSVSSQALYHWATALQKTWSILQYFWPALNDNWSWKPTYGLFESSRFTQVLLYE